MTSIRDIVLTDTINEKTASNGVDIEGVAVRDSYIELSELSADPSAIPVMASSEIGVIKILSSPNFSTIPFVLPNIALWSEASTPKTKTSSSDSISLIWAFTRASTNFIIQNF